MEEIQSIDLEVEQEIFTQIGSFVPLLVESVDKRATRMPLTGMYVFQIRMPDYQTYRWRISVVLNPETNIPDNDSSNVSPNCPPRDISPWSEYVVFPL